MANLNLTWLWVLLLIILVTIYFVHQSLVVDLADKKGYSKMKAGFIGLIPVYGLIYYSKKESLRNTNAAVIKSIFKRKNIKHKFWIHLELVVLVILVMIPVIYICGLAFSGVSSGILNTIWPEKPTIKAFQFLFSDFDKFPRWYLNTLAIALINMVVGTVLITGAGYVFARYRFKGKKAGLLTLLVLQAFPSFMGLVAMYVLFWKFGLLGKPLALSILYIGGSIPFNLWLVKGFLMAIPKDLDESAEIDGANKLQIFFKIILPLSVPIITFVAVGLFMSPWMDYMLPGYLLNFKPVGAGSDYDVQKQWTVAIGLFKYVNDPDMLNYSAFGAGALILGIPITALYVIFQKYLIEGIMAGATKG